MIRTKNLFKTYSNGFPAVSNVSFGIKKNQVLGLLGPNGAGKSSTFNVFTFENPRSYGEVEILQTNIVNLDTHLKGKFMGLCA